MSVITKIGLLVAAFFLVVPQGASALVVSPTSLDVSLRAGEERVVDFFVAEDVRASHVELIAHRVTFGENYNDLTFHPLDEYASWLDFTKESQYLAQNQVGRFEVMLRIPEDALPGVRTFAIRVQERSEMGSLSFGTSVASLLFVAVEGGALESSFHLDECEAASNGRGGLSMVAKVTNAGGGILQPNGTVIEHNVFGGIIAEHTFAFTQRTPPQTTRTYTWLIDAPRAPLARWWRDAWRLRMGPIRVTCAMEGADPRESYVWVMSWGALGLFTLPIGVFGGLLILYRRKS